MKIGSELERKMSKLIKREKERPKGMQRGKRKRLG